MNFEFSTAGRIIFGCGSVRQIPILARDMGKTALLVLGRSSRRGEDLTAALASAGIRSLIFNVGGEPTIRVVHEASKQARRESCDLVIAVGGGSVIDTGKAVAAMLTNPGDVLDYLELVGGGKPVLHRSAPFIAAPTTAGTGTEVTRNAVLDVPEHRVKASLRSHHLLPHVALIDPELTYSLPPDLTAYSGMDALSQLIEPFVSKGANPLIDGVCREGMKLAAESLEAVHHDGANHDAREKMCVAALLSGIALANAKLGAVHGLAGVVGGVTGHPHGAICARLLPFVMEANIRALQGDRSRTDLLERYLEVARILTGNRAAQVDDGVEWVRRLCSELKIPPLREAGLRAGECGPIIPAAQRANSMQGNPVKFSDQQLLKILESAI
jgi:alcohol dehydrogenase class IV